MTFLTQLLASSNPTAMTAEHYGDILGLTPTSSGVSVTPETALKISTVWACVRLISETIASLPLIVYQRRGDGGRERAAGHPLYDLLHDQPNRNQTAFEFREMQMGHTLLRGNAYSKIEGGRRGFADRLIPLHPDRVQVEQIASHSDDLEARYRYRVDGGKAYNDDQILHLRGLSSDGISGVDPITYARESLGLTLAGERYGARFFKNDARPSVVLKHPGKFKNDKTADRIRAHFQSLHGGTGNHSVAVMEEGMDLVTVGVDPRNAQFLELRNFQAEDVARWFRVPPHMVGLTSKATTWGSGIEQMSIGFVVYTLVPWLRRIEQAIARDLILRPDIYFVEHLVDGLLRGDLKTRYEAYAIARDKGWYSVNDIRRKENENPIEGGDAYGTAAPASTVPAPRPPAREAPDDEDEGEDENEDRATGSPPIRRGSAHYEALVFEAAGRILRKEAAALGRAASRGENWPAAVTNFYADHIDYVAQSLRVDAARATRYVSSQMQMLLDGGPAALDHWQTRHLGTLAELAMETP